MNETNTHEQRTENNRKLSTGAKIGGGAVATGMAIAALLLAFRGSNPDSNNTDSVVAADVSISGPGDDVLIGEGNDELTSGPGNDELIGGGDDALLADGDDVLIGTDSVESPPSPIDELDDETIDAILDGSDQGPAPAPAPAPAPVVATEPQMAPGLKSICPSVEHGDDSSGVWVKGEVYGLDSGWIWVEGPTINGGDSLQVPITDGAFDSPLPILQYGDHELTRFEMGTDAVDGFEPIDLLPPLAAGPGDTFPVGPNEGPLFDSPCFDFEPMFLEVDAPQSAESASDETADPETAVPDPALPTVTEAQAVDRANQFLDEFVGAHRNNDVEHLQQTLHPSVRLAYGDDVCTAYVADTAGSLSGAQLISAGVPEPLTMNTPTGPINFEQAIPFTVEFTVTDGSTFVNDAHLPIHDGDVHWLSTCGVEMP